MVTESRPIAVTMHPQLSEHLHVGEPTQMHECACIADSGEVDRFRVHAHVYCTRTCT